jgi:hypothetical protein
MTDELEDETERDQWTRNAPRLTPKQWIEKTKEDLRTLEDRKPTGAISAPTKRESNE